MRKLAIVVSVFAGFILSQYSILSQSATTIEGVVREVGTNRPLGGVSISVTRTGVTPVAYAPREQRNLPSVATTDNDGRFSISLTEPGRIRIVPRLDGFIFTRPGQLRAPSQPGAWVQVNASERISNLELWMTRPATISGRLLQSTGSPLVGTAGSATLYRYSYDASGRRQLGYIPGLTYPGAAGSFVRPDDRGEYRFYDVPPGEYYLAFYGGGQPMGAPQRYYYPGTYDEAKAIPIRIAGGEDLRINAITFPPPPPFYDARFVLKDAAGTLVGARRLYIAGSMIVASPGRQSDETLTVRVAPGSYDIIVTNGAVNDMRYGKAKLDILNSNTDVDVTAMSPVLVTGSISMERDGKALPGSGIRCRIRSQFGLAECSKGEVVPSPHEIELADLPADAYVKSATASGRDITTEGLNIESDTNLEIVLASPGGIAHGVVRDQGGNTVPDAVVALVPDAPRRSFGPHYRAVISDQNGGFEIHGIAPGTYRLFAWTELEGAAYRNADFMKEYEERGKPVFIQKGGQRIAAEITAF